MSQPVIDYGRYQFGPLVISDSKKYPSDEYYADPDHIPSAESEKLFPKDMCDEVAKEVQEAIEQKILDRSEIKPFASFSELFDPQPEPPRKTTSKDKGLSYYIIKSELLTHDCDLPREELVRHASIRTW